MRELKLRDALTTDHHFTQFGFTVLSQPGGAGTKSFAGKFEIRSSKLETNPKYKK